MLKPIKHYTPTDEEALVLRERANAWAKEIAELWITQGQVAAAKRWFELKLVKWEAVILTDKIRNILINNGYNPRRDYAKAN